jgi:hypothetical protein
MKIPNSLLLVAMSCAVAGAAAAQTAPGASPRSLAGDWDSTVNPQARLVLHLHVDAGGALSGTIDVPGSPPQRIVLSNAHLAGNLLTFTMPPMTGKVIEVILPGEKKMAGPYMWVKEGARESPPPPPFEPLSQLAGDWESPGVGPSPLVLRLRLDARGALTGAIDVPEPMAQRVPLKSVEVSGRLLTYTMPDGVHTYQGAFTKDGRTVQATGMSTIEANWHYVRTAAQAAANEAAGNANPANGDWSGAGNYTASFPGVGLTKGTAKLLFHFRSNPASCVVKLEGSDSPVPCRMTASGHTVRIENVIGYGATFAGTLSADKNHLSGIWTMGAPWHWTGPMHIDLTRIPPAQ